MRKVQMIHTEPDFVSISIDVAVYCENCDTVSNSRRGRCGVCGSEAIVSLLTIINGPPNDPGPGSASPAPIVPIFAFERLRAA